MKIGGWPGTMLDFKRKQLLKAIRGMAMRKTRYWIALLLITNLLAVAEKQPKADHVINEAKSRATAERKSIFLIFGASWCPECHTLDSFLKDKEVVAILDKYFVVAQLNV